MLHLFLLWLANPVVLAVCLIIGIYLVICWHGMWEDARLYPERHPRNMAPADAKVFYRKSSTLLILAIAIGLFPLTNFFLAWISGLIGF